MRRLLRIPRLSPKTRSRLRLLVVGAVLATVGGGLVWRLADSRLAAEATRQALAGESGVVAATRDDWPAHVVPVALTDAGPAGETARAVASSKLNQAVSRASRGDVGVLRRLAPRLLTAIRATDDAMTNEGGRWGEWAIRRLAAAAEELPVRQRLAMLTKVDDALTMLMRTPRLAPKPAPVVAEAPLKPVVEPVLNEPPPPAPPTVVVDAPPVVIETQPPPAEPSPRIAAVQPRIATNWRRPQLDNDPAEAPEPTPTSDAAAPAELGDLALLSEALRLERLLPDEADLQAQGPTRIPVSIDDDEAAIRARFDAVRLELFARGFGSVTRRQVEGLLASDERSRVAFVERLLTDRTGDPARVLLLLASDESPAVRAAAISALGGSSSRVLVEKALELATQDEDLRVGRLVEPIRERLR